MKAERILLKTVLYLHHRLERELKRQELPMTLPQYRLLFMIQEGPARSVELAAASGLTKPSVGAQIAAMQEQGWVDRSELQDDKRAASIRITPTGRKALTAFEAGLNKVLKEFLGEDTVTESDENLRWLFDIWTEKRDLAHDQWILRKGRMIDESKPLTD